VESLRFAYDARSPVLADVSFSVADGEKVVLLGSNGCGKTTLLRILAALLTGTDGHYRYRGRSLDRRTLRPGDFMRDFRAEVGLLFQNPDAMIFNPTVRDEIAFGPRQLGVPDAETRAEHWARRLGVGSLLDRPPFRLSSGEKQKVCLASLLALEPKLLLLDEPTAYLDPRSTGWLVDFLRELDLTYLITTHNLSLAPELGERTLVLSERGELIYDGPCEALLGDREKLVAANLVHVHRHRHGDVEHDHFHTHDWE
jgi:cobalt/nickel transport system ATP-binding protein